MNQVLQNVVVAHPCKPIDQQTITLQPVKPYSRAQEEATTGHFNIEEAVQNLLAAMEDDPSYSTDELKEFNQNIEQVISSNGLEKGQNNVTQGAAAPPTGAGRTSG